MPEVNSDVETSKPDKQTKTQSCSTPSKSKLIAKKIFKRQSEVDIAESSPKTPSRNARRFSRAGLEQLYLRSTSTLKSLREIDSEASSLQNTPNEEGRKEKCVNKVEFEFEETGSLEEEVLPCISIPDSSWVLHTSPAENPSPSLDSPALEIDINASAYRNSMQGKEHMNFKAMDPRFGPVLLSVKDISCQEGQKLTHLILRMSSGTFQQYAREHEVDDPDYLVICSRRMCPALNIDHFMPVISRRASVLIADYDERSCLSENNYKFGLLYQGENQVTEEDVLANKDHSPAFQEFLDLIGNCISLRGYTGYAGGLDTVHDQTGQQSISAEYLQCKIMFHVCTMLPLSKQDSQQLQRKRHIGNDIVCLVFQEGNVQFSPDMITSNFLHAYIIVRPVSQTEYEVGVVAKHDVPEFGPIMPKNCRLRKGPKFRAFLLAKLINAENACYKSKIFLSLEQKTRTSLLSKLHEDLTIDTNKYLEPVKSRMNSLDENCLEGKDRSLYKNMKRILSKRSKSLIPNQAKLAASVGRRENLLNEMRGESLEMRAKHMIDPHEDSRIFLGIPHSSVSRSAGNLSSEFPSVGAGVSNPNLRYLSPGISSSSSDEEEEQCDDYVYQLQMELERLRKEKLKLVKSNCDANRKVSDLKRQRQSLSKHLNTVKRQVNLLQMGRSTSLDGSELQTGIFMKNEDDIILMTDSKRRFSHCPTSRYARRVQHIDIEKMNEMLEEKTGILNTSLKKVKEKRKQEDNFDEELRLPSARDSESAMLKQKILKNDGSYNCSNKTRSIINSNPTLSQSVRDKQRHYINRHKFHRPKSSSDLLNSNAAGTPKKEVRISTPSPRSARRGSSLDLPLKVNFKNSEPLQE